MSTCKSYLTIMFHIENIDHSCNCKEQKITYKKLKSFTYNKIKKCRNKFKGHVLQRELLNFTKHCKKVSKVLPGNSIILKRAISKFQSQTSELSFFTNDAIKNLLLEYYKKTLVIKKIKRKWYCDKNRLEIIDFKIGFRLFLNKTVYERDSRCPYKTIYNLLYTNR